MEFCSENSLSFEQPRPDEFEINIFGPGVGECILMHLGHGDWFVIDSCRYPGSEKSAAIAYLEKIGLEPSISIKRILATHWHDDHINGLADIVRRCPNATFAMSAALEQSQFFQLVFEVHESNKLVAANSTASEFADILEYFSSLGKEIVSADVYVSDGTMLYLGGLDESVRVQALSPSAQTITSCMTDVVAKLTTVGGTRRFRHLAPNALSVAVQVSTPALDLLLKADLENANTDQFGWQAVLLSKLRTKRRSQFVKVGHHGSFNAHNDDVWDSMIESKPLSIVTPYSRLSEPLPKDSDVVRLMSRTDQLFATTWPPSRKPPRRRGIDADVASATKSRHAVNREPGFVRARFLLSDPSPIPKIEIYGSAKRMQNA